LIYRLNLPPGGDYEKTPPKRGLDDAGEIIETIAARRLRWLTTGQARCEQMSSASRPAQTETGRQKATSASYQMAYSRITTRTTIKLVSGQKSSGRLSLWLLLCMGSWPPVQDATVRRRS
jgi:hypothetical protein